MTDRYCELAHSRDGSHNLSNFTQHHLGEVGDFTHRVVKRRLGNCRTMTVTCRVSSPIKRNVIGMSI